MRGLCAAFSVVVLAGGAAVSSAPQSPAADVASQASNAQAPAKARVFTADAGLILNFIKPDKAADFETVIAKLHEALRKSDKPERKQQAARRARISAGQ